MKISKSLLPAAALAAVLVGCQDEDFGYQANDIKYRSEFKKAFGKIDPEQDWSMAALVTANLKVDGATTAYVYTEKPGHKGSELAGIVTGKTAQFNLIKGAKQVYVMVEKDDQYVVNGYFNVVNNVIDITSEPVSKASNSTRAEAGSYSVGDRLFTQTAYSKEPQWDEKTYVYQNGLYRIEKEGDEWYIWYAPTAKDTFRKLAHNSDADGNICGYANFQKDVLFADDNTVALSNIYLPGLITTENGQLVFVAANVTKYITYQSWDATYYKISGDTKTDDVEWLIGDCANLFWVGDAVFHESQNYKTTQHKLDAYAKYHTTVEEMEEGVVVVTNKDNARVDIPFMFGATQNDNIFGYYYYTKDEDALTANRYVLYEDAQPSSNIKVNGTAVGDMDLQMQQSGWDRDSKATCTSRHLVYFGEDGKSAGTLDFPKGVKIGFFIMRQHDSYSGFDKDAGQQRTMAETGWAYSDPKLNLKYLIDANGAENNTNWTYSNPTDKTRGSVRALSWTYDGRLLCGFGDQSNDYDLNDFVWWVDGDVTNTTKIRITTQASSSWIVACEDLGGTFDYDFNDLVFALRKTQLKNDKTKATLELIPLAAGGTLDAKLVYGGDVKGEIHDLIQPGASFDEPLNVTAGSAPKEGTPIVVADEENAIGWNDDINTIIKTNVKVQVIQKKDEDAVEKNYFIEAYDKDNKKEDSAPEMLILPSGWDWPAEEVPVKDVYAGFKTWASDASVATWCTEKNGEQKTQFVTNPLPKASIIINEDQEIIVDPVTPGTDDQLKAWDIDFEVNPSILHVGDELELTIKTTGTGKDYGPTAQNYTYAVGDESILSYSANYTWVTLTAKKAGTTTLSVTYDDKHDLTHKPTTKEYTIIVKDAYRDAELSAANMTIGCGKQINLVNGVNYTSKSNGAITVSSNSDLVTVNGTTLTTGTTESVQAVTITINQAESTDEIYGPASCTFQLTVDPAAKDPATLSVTKTATLNLVAKGDAGTITKGSDFDFDLGASNLGVTYSSSDDAIMTVSESNGVVTITPKKAGNAQVLITSASDDIYASGTMSVASVTVVKGATTTMEIGKAYELEFNASSEDLSSLYCKQSFWADLSSYSLPNDASNAEITLTYSNAGNNIQFINASKASIRTFSGWNASPHTETMDVTSFFAGDGFYIGFAGTGMVLSKVEMKIVE